MKIVFITTHNWETKRLGGFHKFAEAAALAGNDVVFFSFPRPYYGYFLHREQINKDVINRLKKGMTYNIEKQTDDTSAGSDEAHSAHLAGKIMNVTFPTFRLPDFTGKILPDAVMNFLLTHSFVSFEKFANRFLQKTDCFVFESCEGVALLPKIKKLFPSAKIVYRPSDPMVYDSVPDRVKMLERKMLYSADINLIVNDEGVAAYKKAFADFDTRVNHKVLSNGIDIESYKRKYDVPELLQKANTILYVGAWAVEWNLIFRAAIELPHCNFIVVCPNYPSDEIQTQIKAASNVEYVPGILPKDVPAWIINCSVVMVPYETDFYKDRPLGITAKYYQAMAAGKPIVAYSDTPKLADVGVAVTYTYEDFICKVRDFVAAAGDVACADSACKKVYEYNFDLKGREWKTVTEKFLDEIENIVNMQLTTEKK